MAYEGGLVRLFSGSYLGGSYDFFGGCSYAFWWAAGAADRAGLALEGAFLGSYGKVCFCTQR